MHKVLKFIFIFSFTCFFTASKFHASDEFQEFDELFDLEQDHKDQGVVRAPRISKKDSESKEDCSPIVCHCHCMCNGAKPDPKPEPEPEPEPTPFCLDRDFCINGDMFIGGRVSAKGFSFIGDTNFIRGSTTVEGKLTLDLNEGMEILNHLYISGMISAESFLTHSDLRLKENIVYLSSKNCLDTVLSLKPCAFYWSEQALKTLKVSEGTRYGFIAQEVKEVLPQAVQIGNSLELAGGQELEEVHRLDYQAFIPELVGALQACNEKILLLEKRIIKLEEALSNDS